MSNRVAARLGSPTPAMPACEVARSVDFYRDMLEFEVVHQDEGFALLRRDASTLTVWAASDESWRNRDEGDTPVRSGAESFIAGTASCRIEVEGVDQLYAQCEELGIVRRTHLEMKHGAAAPRWAARCSVLSRANSAAIGAPCVLASHSPSAPHQRAFIPRRVLPNGHLSDTEWRTREFAVLDPDGNLIGFWESR